jgi:hypothetical protein
MSTVEEATELRKGYRMSKEAAREEFDRFLDLMDLEHKFDDLETPEDVEDAAAVRRLLENAIAKGTLTVDEHGVATLHTEAGPVVFNEPTGAALKAMDKRKNGRNVSKIFVSLAEWTGVNESRFSKMRGRDVNVCMKLFNLFFA